MDNTQACHNPWSAVLQDAFDTALKRGRGHELCRKFIEERWGSFDWICELLGMDSEIVSRRLTDKLKEG